jgi:glycine/D-amino acid oxidase-like deaminating enzyme
MITPSEAAELVAGPAIAGIVGASFCAEDGYFDKPQAVVEAFAEAAQRAGVKIVLRHVERLDRTDGGWRLQLDDRTASSAEVVVLATGYWTPAIAGSLGITPPIVKEARYLFFSSPIGERLLEPLVVASERRFAAKQLADGRVLASDLAAEGDPESGRRHWRTTIAKGIESLLPRLEFVPFDLLVEGFYDVTPDHQPILGPGAGSSSGWRPGSAGTVSCLRRQSGVGSRTRSRARRLTRPSKNCLWAASAAGSSLPSSRSCRCR